MRYFFVGAAGRKSVLRVLCLLLAASALAGCGSSSGNSRSGNSSDPPKKSSVPVHVKTVKPHSVDIYAKYPGRVQGKRTVQITARVEGVLLKRHYNEGQKVKEGQLLYTIDPRPFQATVDQRKAQLASARASRDQAQRAWNRVHRLYNSNAVSKADRDQAKSKLETTKASVQQAQANLESAQINLGYTHVTAPLTGVTSLREVDAGALVNNGTHLTTITQLNPVYILFALPEDDAFARRKALSAMGNKTTQAATREATIILSNGKPYPIKAEVDFTQSTIDPNTGTVQLRAVVKNPNNRLMPGRYVRARVRLDTRKNAIVVPEDAISSGQQQTQVFVVAKGKAKPVTVKLGPDVAAGKIINDGLSPGEKVITSGLASLKPGAPVKVVKSGGKPKPKKSSGGEVAAAKPSHPRGGQTQPKPSRKVKNVASAGGASSGLRMAGPLGYAQGAGHKHRGG